MRRAGRGAVASIWRALVLALAAAVWAGCGRPMPETGTADRSLAERVRGCWSLSPGEDGTAADTVRRWLEEGVLPGAIRLDSATIGETAGGGDLYRARAYVRSREQPRLLTSWWTVAPDSIRVETPGALAGMALRLATRPDGLSGTAVSFTDAVGPGGTGRATGPVEARPGTCPE